MLPGFDATGGLAYNCEDIMANHPSALKRVRQTRSRTIRNRANASRLRTAMKKLKLAIDKGDTAAAASLLQPTLAQIDKGIQKGVLHRNAAGRHKSQFARAVNRLQAK
jgi:small subunit ribosomal protein S20